MEFLNKIKRGIKAAWTDPLDAVVVANGLSTDAGQLVNINTASRVATFTAGINLLANDISSLPLNVMVRTADGPKYAANHPLTFLLGSEWNNEITAREGMEHTVRMLLTHGNFYNQLVLDKTTGVVLAIHPLYAPNVRGRRLTDYEMGRMGLTIGVDSNLAWDYTDPEQNSIRTIHDSFVWRGSMNTKYGIVGEGLVSVGKHALGTAIAADKAGARLFKKGTISDYYFQPEQGSDLSIDEWKKLSIAWERGADGSYTKPVVPQGVRVNRLEAPTAQQAQFIERQKRQDLEICRLLNIPASILDASDKGASFGATESERRWYVDHTLRPLLTIITQGINARCFGTREKAKYFAEFDTDALTSADKAARYTANKEALSGASWMTINEIRAEESLPPLAGGDVLLVPANNLGTLDKSGKIIPAAPAPTTAPANARFEQIVKAQAERIVTKEAKAKKYEADFVSKLLCISLDAAQRYCSDRESGTITDEQAMAVLVGLATEVPNEATL